MVRRTLTELRTAFEQNDDDSIVDLIPQVMEEFDRRREREAALEELTVKARNEGAGSAAAQAGRDLSAASGRTRMARLRVAKSLNAYLQDRSDGSPIAAIDDALATYDEYNETRDQFQGTVEDVGVGGVPFLSAPDEIPVPKGTDVSGSLTLENVGTEPLTDVSLSVRTDLPVSLARETVDRVPAGESVTVELASDEPPSAGGSVRFTAKAGSERNSARTQVLVTDKKEYLERAIEQLEKLYVTFRKRAATDWSATDDGEERPADEGAAGIENKIETITRRIVGVIDKLIEGRPPVHALDNQIGSVRNQLGALSNQIEAQSGGVLPAGTAKQLQMDVESIDSTLETAVAATE